MKFIKHKIPVPENESFMVHELEQCSKRDVIHSHKNYELNYMVNARGRRFVEGNIANFREGDLVMMGPEVAHGWEITNKKDSPTSITIHFAEDFFKTGLFDIPEFKCLRNILDQSKYGLYFQGIQPNIIERELRILMGRDGFDSMIQLLRILRYLSRTKDIHLLSNPGYMWGGRLSNDERINKIYDYVFRNFHNDINLEKVAGLVNLSESAFCTYFKKNTKHSFFTFLKEVKINFACKLLTTENNKTIAEICFESGYRNIANFNRQFKEITGLSPREYRKAYG
ncbi:MAG: AraC family transcriptional regulator [Bacteroidales bacterium]